MSHELQPEKGMDEERIKREFLAYRKPQSHEEYTERKKAEAAAAVSHVATPVDVHVEPVSLTATQFPAQNPRELQVFTPSARKQDEMWARWHDLELPEVSPLGVLVVSTPDESVEGTNLELRALPAVPYDKVLDALTSRW